MTEETIIPGQVSDLIRASIHSLEELELLLLLRRGPGRSWSTEQIARGLHVTESIAAAAARALTTHELVEQVVEAAAVRYRYRVQAPEAEEVVEALARQCAQNRVPVLMQISSNAIERVRKGALQTFSDVFRPSGRRRDG